MVEERSSGQFLFSGMTEKRSDKNETQCVIVGKGHAKVRRGKQRVGKRIGRRGGRQLERDMKSWRGERQSGETDLGDQVWCV